jgi:Na+-transporting NADH:ubiquinone oxidoreductase subunit C
VMRQTGAYPVVYMFVVTAAFSTVVIGLSAMTRERVEANARLALESAVLRALPTEGAEPESLRGADVHRRFTEQVTAPDASSGGAYTLKKGGQIVAYAVPFEGRGFWATIRGVIGVAADKETVTGIAFYEQSETPGLGAEIVKPAFRNQFEGKVLAENERPIAMRRPGATLGKNDVYAVTGATQTSVRVESMVNQAIREWRAKVGGEGGAS